MRIQMPRRFACRLYLRVALLTAFMSPFAGAQSGVRSLNQSYMELLQSQQERGDRFRKFQSPPFVSSDWVDDLGHGFIGKEAGLRPISKELSFSGRWRQAKETLILRNLDAYQIREGERPKRFFAMATNGARGYTLTIESLYFDSGSGRAYAKSFFPTDETPSRLYLEADLQCDRDVEVRFNLSKKTGRRIKFKIFSSKQNGQNQSLVLRDENTSCVLRLNDRYTQRFYAMSLIPERQAHPKLAPYMDRYEACVMPGTDGLAPVEEFMMSSRYHSLTCPMEIEDIETLEDSIEGLQVKVEALAGVRLGDQDLSEKNPDATLMRLNLEKNAPRLDSILISYLVFRADYYGTLMARLVKFHADRGTPVRIVVSGSIILDKDEDMLLGLMEQNSNIKVGSRKYESKKWWSPKEWIHELHRSMHVKLFVTTCSESPKCNLAVIGGRNIHDGFVFETKPDHRWNPKMVHYGRDRAADESFVHWLDFDVAIRSPEFVRRIVQQFYTFWYQDPETYTVRSFNFNLLARRPLDFNYLKGDKPVVRHLISVPYADGRALDDFYVDMLRSAQKRVRIVSPYFRTTDKIREALEDAVQRGVDITLITRINLDGDTADIILSDVNKKGINQFLNRIKIYEFTTDGIILHSKIVLIDDKFALLGSVNWNKRSFFHDSENSLMIYSPDFVARMNTILEYYKAPNRAREVTEKQKVAFWKSIVIGLVDTAL